MVGPALQNSVQQRVPGAEVASQRCVTRSDGLGNLPHGHALKALGGEHVESSFNQGGTRPLPIGVGSPTGWVGVPVGAVGWGHEVTLPAQYEPMWHAFSCQRVPFWNTLGYGGGIRSTRVGDGGR